MGKILEALGLRPSIPVDVTAGLDGTFDPSTLPIASPWADSSNLQRIVYEDVFGSEIPVNTRTAAMRIPAIARGRNLLVASISQLPLVGYRGDTPLERQPSWISSWGGGQSPQLRLAWTVDDLIFYGWSCWYRVNGADGFPIDVQRVNFGDWTVNPDNRVEIHGNPVDDRDVIVIPGLHEGILTFGKDVLQDARTLYCVVRDRLLSPVPPIELHQEDGRDLSNTEIDDLIDRWVKARRSGRMVGYTNKNIRATVLESGDANLMIEARNAASLDLARAIGVTAGMIDATAPKASLNYETTTGRNQEFVDRDLLLYLTPLWARLSGDDVMPHGQRVVFDSSAFTTPAGSPTGPILED